MSTRNAYSRMVERTITLEFRKKSHFTASNFYSKANSKTNVSLWYKSNLISIITFMQIQEECSEPYRLKNELCEELFVRLERIGDTEVKCNLDIFISGHRSTMNTFLYSGLEWSFFSVRCAS